MLRDNVTVVKDSLGKQERKMQLNSMVHAGKLCALARMLALPFKV